MAGWRKAMALVFLVWWAVLAGPAYGAGSAAAPTEGARVAGAPRTPALSQPPDTPGLAELLERVDRAAITFDTLALARAVAELEPLAAQPGGPAGAHYAIALAEWAFAEQTMTGLPGVDPRVTHAEEHLARATELDPAHAAAYALWSRLDGMRISVDRERAAEWADSARVHLRRALAAGPDLPETVFFHALALVFMPPERGGGFAAAEARYRGAIDRLPDPQDMAPGARWVGAWLHAYYAFSLLAMPADRFEDGWHHVHAALDREPDFALARERLLPALATQRFAAPPDAPATSWRVVAEDPAGDGANPRLADGRRAAVYHDAARDLVWLRVDMHALPDPGNVGVNVLVDLDGDPATGSGWWGGTPSWRYDRLVTVWVRDHGKGAFRGTVGVADAADARIGLYTTIARNELPVAIDPGSGSVYLAVPGHLLRRTDRDDSWASLAFAVGSSTFWNDDLGQGWASLSSAGTRPPAPRASSSADGSPSRSGSGRPAGPR